MILLITRWFGSIQTFIEFSIAMFVGRYFDIHGPHLLVSLSVVLSAVALVGLARKLRTKAI